MSDTTNSKRATKVMAIAAGMLVVALGSPAFAVAGTSGAQFAGGSVIKNVSNAPAQVGQSHGKKGVPTPGRYRTPVLIGTLKGVGHYAITSIPCVGLVIDAVIVGMSDGSDPF
jgi:hypothetical protein